jgi:hypothetical protein
MLRPNSRNRLIDNAGACVSFLHHGVLKARRLGKNQNRFFPVAKRSPRQGKPRARDSAGQQKLTAAEEFSFPKRMAGKFDDRSDSS